jgi:beta-lactamase regulating signal transducer with metallopeptidase domain
MLSRTLEILSNHPLADALGASLLHFMWQGVAVAVVLVVALRLLRGRGAPVRYLASCVALAAMLVLPVTTFLVLAWGGAAPAAGYGAASTLSSTPILVSQYTTPAQWLGAAAAVIQPWIVTLWLAGVALLTVRFAGAWMGTQRLRVRATRDADDELRAVAQRLAGRLGITRAPRLLLSGFVQTPMTLGWLRPVVLLPVSAVIGLEPRQLELVLAHELAHVRRHDYLVNLLQTLTESLLFYHPAVWWVSRCVRAERENCCDDLAVDVCGDPVSLARALAALEEMRVRPAVGLAAAATDGPLLQRVRRLLGVPVVADRRRAGWSAALALVVSALVLGLGAQRSATASSDDDGAEDEAPPVTLEVYIPEVPLIPMVAEEPEDDEAPELPVAPSPPVAPLPPEAPALPAVPTFPALGEIPPLPEVPEIPSNLGSEKALERYFSLNGEEWERFGEDMERWAEAFEADEESWERFGEDMERWADEWAVEFESAAGDYAMVWMGDHEGALADELQRQADELERQAEELRRRAEEIEREAARAERERQRESRLRQRGKRDRGADDESP